ncbi:MAG TPA: polysaccharide deacetylase family protein, partial [Rhodanobacteraceae bacterium]|nr:polysaccharide deacetylase family protein [Rhodanobacteraceae bacterium]
YHSNNVGGNEYDTNDHVALAADLRVIRRAGLRIVPLARVVDALLGTTALPERAVALSFDDGSYFDWYDMDHPTCGPQRGFAGILREFAAKTGAAAHATSFVIVSPDARAILDRTCLAGRGWWGDDWWRDAEREGLIAIESHSWDHNHHTLPSTVQREQDKGTFRSIDTHADADAEIRAANDWLDMHARAPRAGLFAYPYGETNDYLVRDYLPRHVAEHRLRAAFGTKPEPVTRASARWNLPRYVCGHHWRSTDELARLVDDGAGSG